MSRHDPYMTPELEAALSLSDEINARAMELESVRRLPADLAAKMAATGLFEMAIPAVYGGRERTLAQIMRAGEAMSYADGSVGWSTLIYTTSAVVAGYLSPAWGREIFSRKKGVIFCGATPPVGRGEFVPSGIKVSGRWPWGSGMHNADWIQGGTIVMEGDKMPQLPTGEPRVHMLIFERAQVIVHDNWNPSGLIGTGSGDFEVKDAFVPEGRWFVLGETKPTLDGPLYRFPFFSLLASAHTAVSLGLAQRAIDTLVDLARNKVPMWNVNTLAKNPLVQTGLGRAEAQLNAIRSDIYTAVDEVWDKVASGGEASLEDRRRLRIAAVNVTEMSTSIIDQMYLLGGGSSVHRNNPLQRCMRDAHVTTQHAMVGQAHYMTAGRLKMLGERPIAMF